MLRLSEVYASVQGEGPRVGCPTIFVRFAGCNLRCPKWPCDTPHAIDPEKYRSEWRTVPYGNVVEEVLAAGPDCYNICYTGGEPFLQPSEDLELLTTTLTEAGFSVFEAFTNGTLEWPEWTDDRIHRVLDWKLSGSGELLEQRPRNIRYDNLMSMDSEDSIKFTIADESDFDQAIDAYESILDMFLKAGVATFNIPQFFYGPVWGKVEPSQLVEWAMVRGLPWRLNLQVHNMIWDRTARGI